MDSGSETGDILAPLASLKRSCRVVNIRLCCYIDISQSWCENHRFWDPGQSDFARDKRAEGLAREGVRHLGAWSKPSWSMEYDILELEEHRFYRSARDLGAESTLASGLGAWSVT